MPKCELVPDDLSPRELRAEAGLRAHRAGYDVTRSGDCPGPKIQGLVNFGRQKLKLWPRDRWGRLIDD